MKQKITLTNDGVVAFNRMKLHHPTAAKNTPSIGLSRLQKLLKTGQPHICFVRGEGIGDVLMITPTISAVRQMFSSKATISVATNTKYLEGALVQVLKYNPDIDYILERNLMRDSDYDLIINLHCPAIKVEVKGNKPPNRIDIFAQHAGVKLIDPKPKYFIQKDEIEWGKQFFLRKRPNTKTILVQLCSSSTHRSIDNNRIKNALIILNKNYGIESIILRHDTDPGSNIEWSEVPGVQEINTDVRGIAAIMVHCDLVLCPDSSVLHLAGALSVPTVSIFTSTYPPSRINHYPKATALWDGYNIPMCPCWYSYNTCTVKGACYTRITGERIAETCFSMLSTTSKIDTLSLVNNIPAVSIDTEIL